MAEKRRGLGRGLGALIPSAPVEEVTEPAQPEADPATDRVAENAASEGSRKPAGRPVDLFFERVTEEDVAEQPRSYSSALRSGINKNMLDAQSKRVAKSSTARKNAGGGDTRSAKQSQPKTATTQTPDTEGSAADVPRTVSGKENGSDQARKESAVGADERAGAGRRTEVPGRSEESATASEQGDARVAEHLVESADSLVAPDRDSSAALHSDSSIDTGSRETGMEDPDFAMARPEHGGSDAALVPVPGATFAELPLDSIHPNRKQPRVEFNEDELAELVHSIREIGVLQPVVVRPSQEGGTTSYELVMGERRWRASREAGMHSIPAIVRSTLDDDLLRDALLENLHRSALNPLEEAAAYQQLLDDFGCSHDELAGRLGRSRPQISNTLRLMKLPPLVQRRVAAGVLSAGHARALLGLGDPADMEKLAQRIVAEGLSVRSTEEIVALSGGLRRAAKPSAPRDGARHERLDYLATSLSDRLDTNVKITLGAKKGRVSIEFASVDDLNRIIGVLSPPSE
ncbi:hypothetical protein MN0502_33600 [Arthrobacter sp. MN05-02]|nr:hypothetical protein MN0502_33600 [Arthrobacter sp. MN05-02]